MKKNYNKPCVEGTEAVTAYGIMIGPSGEGKPEDAMGKRQDVVIVEDEEDEEDAGKAVASKSFHSNDYLKKIWD